MYRQLLAALISVTLFASIACAQTQSNPKAKPLSPTARLRAAKTAYLKNAGGSEVPFNVISDGIQGWGRYQIVNSPDKADIIVEVNSPREGGGVSVTSTTSTDPQTGMPTQSTTTSHELSVARITMIVYDAKSKMALWSASEQPKSAMREKTRNDNIVEAAEHLVTKFHQRVEPELAQ